MQTFFEYYQRTIQPKLAAIDVFLKTEPQPYRHKMVAELLDITETELAMLMQREKLAIITKGTFMQLLQLAPSAHCAMLGREVRCGMPRIYSVAVIAYIYDLRLADVAAAAKACGQRKFTAKELPELFRHIFISDKRCRL